MWAPLVATKLKEVQALPFEDLHTIIEGLEGRSYKPPAPGVPHPATGVMAVDVLYNEYCNCGTRNANADIPRFGCRQSAAVWIFT